MISKMHLIIYYYGSVLIGGFFGSYLYERRLISSLMKALIVSAFIGIFPQLSYKLSRVNKIFAKGLVFFLTPLVSGILAFAVIQLIFPNHLTSLCTVLGAWGGLLIFFTTKVWWTVKHRYGSKASTSYLIIDKYFEAGNMDKAIKECKKIVSKAPNPKLGYCWLGYLFHNNRQYNEAVTYYEKALEIDPKDPKLLYSCALAYFKAGEHEMAKQYLERGGYKYKEEQAARSAPVKPSRFLREPSDIS